MQEKISLADIKDSRDKDFEHIYNMNIDNDEDDDVVSPYTVCQTNCTYYESDEIHSIVDEYREGVSFFSFKLSGDWSPLG